MDECVRKITQAMIEAGIEALMSWGQDQNPLPEVVSDIYRAMENERRRASYETNGTPDLST